MKIYLQTRGVAHDYAFLGEAPSDYWWAVPFYKDATSFEQPSLILEYGKPRAGEWRCFISAIPSGRRDCVNTRIRYSIALSGGGEADTDVLRKLLAFVLDIFSKNPVSENNSLTELLDTKVGGDADEWLGANAKQEQIQDIIKELKAEFKALELYSDSGDLSKLYKELWKFLKNVQKNSTRRVALLNFIGEKDDPSAKHLQSQVKISGGKILILPSPVAGGQLKEYFVLGALEENSFEKDTNHTADELKAGRSDASGEKHSLGVVKGAQQPGLVPKRTREANSTANRDRERVQTTSQNNLVRKPFSVGSQGNNQTTEGHNTMGSSFGPSDVKGSRHKGIVLIVAVTIIVALLVVAGCYLSRD